jgi:N utilization substance protein B
LRRRLARELVVQILYYLELNEVPSYNAADYVIDEIRENDEGQMLLANDVIDANYIMSMVAGTRKFSVQFDRIFSDYLKKWRLERLSKVDTQILRLALYELLFAEDVPQAAVMNEAVELAKRFGTEESGKFVNGVLGKVLLDLQQIRQQLDQQGEAE